MIVGAMICIGATCPLAYDVVVIARMADLDVPGRDGVLVTTPEQPHSIKKLYEATADGGAYLDRPPPIAPYVDQPKRRVNPSARPPSGALLRRRPK